MEIGRHDAFLRVIVRRDCRSGDRRSIIERDGSGDIVDVPADQIDLIDIAGAYGLRPQRAFLRMCRGDDVRENPSLFHISSGPEFG